MAAEATVRALRAGVGVLDVLGHPGAGEVLAWFSRACYLRVPGGVITLVGPDVHDGPIHLVLDEPLPEVPARTPAWLTTEELGIGSNCVLVDEVVPWRGSLPEPVAVRGAAMATAEVLADAAAGSLLPEPTASEARVLVERDDLEAVARDLAGLGPGLTPSGDDVLGGVLFAWRASRGPAEEPRLAAVAEGVATNDIARAFLRWAARGQALAPVHDLLGSAVRGQRGAATVAGRALAAVGESSGADFALGLRWGMRASGTQ
ncbi:MAG: DUF2877 domain-containing protein [Actinomycetota bacterium]